MSKISCEICPLFAACNYVSDMPCPDSVLEAYLKYPELCDLDDPQDIDESFDVITLGELSAD